MVPDGFLASVSAGRFVTTLNRPPVCATRRSNTSIETLISVFQSNGGFANARRPGGSAGASRICRSDRRHRIFRISHSLKEATADRFDIDDRVICSAEAPHVGDVARTCMSKALRTATCDACGMVIDCVAHVLLRATPTRQLRMRHFRGGDEIRVEPWRAAAVPVVKDLVLERGALDRIIADGGFGGFITAPTGGAPDGNAIAIPKHNADAAMDAASCKPVPPDVEEWGQVKEKFALLKR